MGQETELSGSEVRGPARAQARQLVAYMWVAYLLNYCDRQVVFSIFPILKVELRFTDVQLGLTGAIFLWVYGLSSPFAGQIGDKISKRLLVLSSLLLWSAITVLTGFSTSARVLLIFRGLMGISEALYMPSAVSLTANSFPPGARSRALASLMTAQMSGIVLGGWFGGYMADRGEWRSAFYVLGIVGILYGVPYFFFLRRIDEETPVETKRSGSFLAVTELARAPTYGILCLVFVVFTFGLWLLYGWLPNFFYEKFSLTLAQAAFTATAYMQGSTLIGMVCAGWLSDRLYQKTRAARCWLIAGAFLTCAPCFHFLGNAESLLWTKMAALGFGFCSGFFIANIFPASFEIVPADARASAVGFLNFFGAIISGFATLMGGVWKKTLGIENLISAAALAYLFAGLLMIFGIRLFFQRDFDRVH